MVAENEKTTNFKISELGLTARLGARGCARLHRGERESVSMGSSDVPAWGLRDNGGLDRLVVRLLPFAQEVLVRVQGSTLDHDARSLSQG